MNWIKENKRHIYNFLWTLLFLIIVYLLLTTDTNMGHNLRSFDLGGEW